MTESAGLCRRPPVGNVDGRSRTASNVGPGVPARPSPAAVSVEICSLGPAGWYNAVNGVRKATATRLGNVGPPKSGSGHALG